MALILCVSCKVGPTGTGSEDEQIKVSTITMSKSTDMRTRSYVGQAKASKSATLISPYPGTLRTLDVSVGEHVSEGDVLAEVHSESVKSVYDMSRAALEQAEDGYARVRQVKEKGGVPDVRFKEVEADLAKARAAASAAEDAVKSGTITAPFDGVVSRIHTHQGAETVLHAPLMRIIDPMSVEIEFSIPEGELSEIYEGMPAEVDIPALNVEGAEAEVKIKGVEASPVTHTYECSLKLLHPVDGLAPGMVCKVALGKDMQPDYIVPAHIVQTDRNGRYVWTVEDGTVRKTYVVTGGFAGNGVIVTDGLSDGTQVIREGFRKVSSGMKVRVE